jgi:hypothetical protein
MYLNSLTGKQFWDLFKTDPVKFKKNFKITPEIESEVWAALHTINDKSMRMKKKFSGNSQFLLMFDRRISCSNFQI